MRSTNKERRHDVLSATLVSSIPLRRQQPNLSYQTSHRCSLCSLCTEIRLLILARLTTTEEVEQVSRSCGRLTSVRLRFEQSIAHVLLANFFSGKELLIRAASVVQALEGSTILINQIERQLNLFHAYMSDDREIIPKLLTFEDVNAFHMRHAQTQIMTEIIRETIMMRMDYHIGPVQYPKEYESTPTEQHHIELTL
ncbi:hypothetical protein TruAng_005490 [Truncatella angustata]|nr:hypothetical protein TruAng_005490 [Truncatella angustata]